MQTDGGAQQQTNRGPVVNRDNGTRPSVPDRKPVYMTQGGASQAGKGMRSKDPETRKQAAQYMAQYRKKKKQTK